MFTNRKSVCEGRLLYYYYGNCGLRLYPSRELEDRHVLYKSVKQAKVLKSR